MFFEGKYDNGIWEGRWGAIMIETHFINMYEILNLIKMFKASTYHKWIIIVDINLNKL